MEILQTNDGFLWGNVTDKAKEIFNSGLFELYVVYYDGVDYLIEDFDELNEILGTGQGIYIELNHLKNIKQLN
jgi:hypothetical protein